MIGKQQILTRIRAVPSLPSVVIKLRQYLNNPEVSFDELAKVIEVDPGLTANILQLANSAYFGWARSIKTVKEAITRLGTNRIFQMVLCMSVAPLVRKPIKGYDMDSGALWEHSIAVAVCAEKLTTRLGLKGLDEAFTSGLLHDLGKIVLGTFVEVDDEPIMEIVHKDHLSFNEAEMMVLGIDHAEVAGELLSAWNLPEEVVEAARWHHAPGRAEPAFQRLVDLIHVADVLCINVGWGMGSDGLRYRLDADAAARLGVDGAVAEDVILQATIGLEELKELFDPGRKEAPDGVRHPAR